MPPSAARATAAAADDPASPALRRPSLWAAAMLAIAIAAAVLRYHDIHRQIPLGDEWHSLALAARARLEDLHHYFPRATAIPINLYQRWLLEHFGWNETSIRLLSIVSTVVTLLLLPWGVQRVTGSRTMAATVLVLFAVSPFWIFYGQNSRPYAPYLLFLLLAQYCFWRALRADVTRAWVGFAVFTGLAAYFHLYALPALGSLASVALVRAWWLWRKERTGTRFFVRSVLGFIGAGAVTLALFSGTSLSDLSDKVPAGKGAQPLDATFFRHSAELVTGVQSSWLAGALIALALIGLVSLWRKDPWLVAMLLVSALASIAFTLVVRPRWYFVALVLVRYNLGLFLLFYLGLARFVVLAVHVPRRYGRVSWASASRSRARAAAVAALAALAVFASPLSTTLAAYPNNFRQHSAYVEFYSGWDPTRTRASAFFGGYDRVTRERIPPFYAMLKERHRGDCRVIEFPLPLHDHQAPYYFYQAFHGCEVLAGYTREDHIGSMLRLEKHANRLRFRRLVNLERLGRARKPRADYVIVHHNVRQEAEARRRIKLTADSEALLTTLPKKLGPPVYEDRYVTVFKLRPK